MRKRLCNLTDMRRPTKFYIETPQKEKTLISNNNCPCAYHKGL